MPRDREDEHSSEQEQTPQVSEPAMNDGDADQQIARRASMALLYQHLGRAPASPGKRTRTQTRYGAMGGGAVQRKPTQPAARQRPAVSARHVRGTVGASPAIAGHIEPVRVTMPDDGVLPYTCRMLLHPGGSPVIDDAPTQVAQPGAEAVFNLLPSGETGTTIVSFEVSGADGRLLYTQPVTIEVRPAQNTLNPISDGPTQAKESTGPAGANQTAPTINGSRAPTHDEGVDSATPRPERKPPSAEPQDEYRRDVERAHWRRHAKRGNEEQEGHVRHDISRIRENILGVFDIREAGVKVAQREAGMTGPEHVDEKSINLLLDLARFALESVTGPMGEVVVELLFAAGSSHPGSHGSGQHGGRDALATAVQKPIIRLFEGGLNAFLEPLVDDLLEDTAGGSAHPEENPYGKMDARAQRDQLGGAPISIDPRLSFFAAQWLAIRRARNHTEEYLNAIELDAVAGAGEPGMVEGLKRMREQTEKDKKLKLLQPQQVNSSLVAWMSFLAQMMHGSEHSGGSWAADLSRADPYNTLRALHVRISADPLTPHKAARRLSWSYDGFKDDRVRDRLRHIDLLALPVPVVVSDPQNGIVATRNRAGTVTVSGPAATEYFYWKGRSAYWTGEGNKADNPPEDLMTTSGEGAAERSEDWVQKGARYLLESEVLNAEIGGLPITGETKREHETDAS